MPNHEVMKKELAAALRLKIREWNGTQSEAGKRLGISQQRVGHLLKPKHLGRFRLEMLLKFAERAKIPIVLLIGDPAKVLQEKERKLLAKREVHAKPKLGGQTLIHYLLD